MATLVFRDSAIDPGTPVERTLQLSVVEGCFAMLPATFTTGVFLTGFALLLHADAWALGLLAAIPAFGQVAQLVAAALLAGRERRKRLTVWGASIGRYLWLPVAFLPFTPLPDAVRLDLFFVLLAAANVLCNMAGVAWTSWMGDLVPASVRGRYFGHRNAVNLVAGMACVWAGSSLLSHFKAAGHEALGFAVVLGLALVGAVASQLALASQTAPPPVAPRPDAPFWHTFRRPAKDLPFLRVAGPLAAWTLVVNITGPFCTPYALQSLKIDYATLGLYTMLTSAVSVVSQLFWGRWIDRVGARKALLITTAPIVLHPITWFVMHPGFTAPIWVDALSTGFFWTGFNLATFALLLEHAPRGEQAPYTSLFNTVSGVATALGALIGGAVLSRLGDGTVHVAGMTLVAFQVLLLPMVGLRLACYLAMVRAARTPATPTITIDVWAAAHSPAVNEALEAQAG